MPPDNSDSVAPGQVVDFPENGPTSSGGIARSGAGTFNLADVGTYLIYFQVPVSQPGQLVLTLNGTELASSVAGRSGGASQISNMVLATTTAANSTLTVSNPTANPCDLTITPCCTECTEPVSAQLVIVRIL